jgi:hypothetical protein
MVPDYLCSQAESLIRALSDERLVARQPPRSSTEVVDGYAHVMALDVDRMRLEREIARLAESGDPRVASELKDLSVLLRRVRSTSVQLRALLGELREQTDAEAQL